MIRGYSTPRTSSDRICQTSVEICKEQPFWLVRGIELLYTVIERRIRRYLVLDDSVLSQWSECQSAHWTIICQGIPVVLVDRSGALAIFLASRIGTRLVPSTDISASFAPRVADEAAEAYESGGRIRAIRPRAGWKIRRDAPGAK
jgi:hypothetical protein